MIAAFTFAFLVGTITTVNPCGFVLLPAYFAHRLGLETNGDEHKISAIFNALIIGLSTTAGFVFVFATVGGAIIFGATWLTQVFPWAGFIIGIILMITGLATLAGLRITLRLPDLKKVPEKNNLTGDFIYGVGYAIISLSCTLPIFLTITGASFAEGALSNLLSFIAFTLGVGTILTTLSISAALARDGLVRILKHLLPYVQRIGGGLLFLAGTYISYLWGTALFATEIPNSKILAEGERISTTLKVLLSEPIGQWLMFVLLALIMIISGWALINRQGGKHPKPK